MPSNGDGAAVCNGNWVCEGFRERNDISFRVLGLRHFVGKRRLSGVSSDAPHEYEIESFLCCILRGLT